jgi:hypothetical protein
MVVGQYFSGAHEPVTGKVNAIEIIGRGRDPAGKATIHSYEKASLSSGQTKTHNKSNRRKK